MVPSLTETLLEAGANVVGRTRYCIHPQDKVQHIPVVGGTKNWDLGKLAELEPDLVVLDKEENPKSMTEGHSWPWMCTHVRGVGDLPRELQRLHEITGMAPLKEFAERCRSVLQTCAGRRNNRKDILNLPGVLEWLIPPVHEVREIVYMIWKKPWMCVSKGTYIGSVFETLGFSELIQTHDENYPQVDLANLDPQRTLLLFSSEPFPFMKVKTELKSLGFPSALVDGESFSWFGIRSLRFLESSL
jgi:hypothetical protein